MNYISSQPFGQQSSPFAPQSSSFPYASPWNAGASHPLQQIQQFVHIVPQQIQQLQALQQVQIQYLQQLLQTVPAQLQQLQHLVQIASSGFQQPFQQPLQSIGQAAQNPLGLAFLPQAFGSQVPSHVM